MYICMYIGVYFHEICLRINVKNHVMNNEGKHPKGEVKNLPGVGFEPTSPCGDQILSLAP